MEATFASVYEDQAGNSSVDLIQVVVWIVLCLHELIGLIRSLYSWGRAQYFQSVAL